MVPTKGTRQIWIRLVEYCSSEVSDPSEVPWIVGKLIFWLVKGVKLICVRSIITCLCVPSDSSVQNIFSKFF